MQHHNKARAVVKVSCLILKVGDEFSVVGPRLKIDPTKMKGEICVAALHSIWPYIQAMRFGAEFSWADKAGRPFECCPDPDGLVVFELKKGPMIPMILQTK